MDLKKGSNSKHESKGVGRKIESARNWIAKHVSKR